MGSNTLQLNTTKTEIIRLATGCRLHQLATQPLRVSSDLAMPVSVVRDLGIYTDFDVIQCHPDHVCLFCTNRSWVHSVPTDVLQSLASSLVLPQLDYCNSVLASIPLHLVWLHGSSVYLRSMTMLMILLAYCTSYIG